MDSTGARDHKPVGFGARSSCNRLLRAVAIIWTALASPLAAADTGSAPAAGCLDGGVPGQVASVEPDLDLKLTDGREVQLAGIDPWRPPENPDAVATRRTLASWLVGRTVLVRPLAAEADCWGRLPALVLTDGAPNGTGTADQRVPLAETVLDAGLARARPDPRLSGCWAHEAAARTRRLGLWAQARYAMIAADDRARLLAGIGSMAIVKGRIVRIVEGRARTYLAFGHAGREDFALSVPKAVATKWRAAGVDPASWRNRDLQARGFLDDRFGLQIELTSTDQIEFTSP